VTTPKKGVAYDFSLSLSDSASPANFKANPTIAAGDFKVSIDNGSFNNLATLPTVAPAGSILVRIQLSSTEMNGDKVVVWAKDAAGEEWEEVMSFIDVPVRNVEDTPSDVWAYLVEGANSAVEYIRLLKAAALGKSSGGGTTSITFRDDADTKDRITATVTSVGDRAEVTKDGT